MGIRAISKNIGFFICLCFLLTACKQETFESEEALLSFVKDPANGLIKQKQIGDVQFTLTYRPTDILVKQELNKGANEADIAALRAKYGYYLYFNLSMSISDQELLNTQVGSKENFGAMVHRLSFGMNESVHLISQKRDTIPIADYIYPRMYGMSKSTNLLLVYPRDPKLFEGKYFHFRIEDLGMGTGEVGFKMPTASFKQEPKLQSNVLNL